MAGKHSAPNEGGGGTALAVVLGLVLVGGVGFGAYQLLSDDGDDTTSASSPSAPAGTASESASGSDHSTHSGTDDAASAAAPSDPSGSSSAASQTPAPSDGSLPAGCRTQLDAGDKAVKAASASWRSWTGHTNADKDYRAGKISWDQTKKIWADTKKNGDSDVSGFDKAYKPYVSAKSGGCDSIDRGTASPQVRDCLDRAGVLDKAVGAGRDVNGDWGKHVAMMKRKDHTNPETYLKEWRSMVSGAGPNQQAFAKARSAYDKAPSCDA